MQCPVVDDDGRLQGDILRDPNSEMSQPSSQPESICVFRQHDNRIYIYTYDRIKSLYRNICRIC